MTINSEFKQGSEKTLQSVISVANSKIQDFNLPNVKNLTHCDTLNLETLGDNDRKIALFIIIPSSDTTFNFLAAMMYTQMFDILYKRANFKYGGRLPVHVRFLLDEFANLGQIPDFENLIAKMRSMVISVNIILQSISQLKKLYEKSWDTIIASCDSFLFLGGQDETTLELVSKRLGKETIDIVSHNRTRGRQSSTSENNSLHGRELLTPDELVRIDNSDCILFVRGYNPFYSKKYDLTSHPNYMYTGRSSPENAYDYRNVKSLTMPKLTQQAKEERRKEIHFEPAEPIAGVNQTIREEIKSRKITETNIFGDLKFKTFDEVPPQFAEVTPAAIDADNKEGDYIFKIDMGGILYDINDSGNDFEIEDNSADENSVFSFSDEQSDDYY
jgi:type IV secretion system protein VirD4